MTRPDQLHGGELLKALSAPALDARYVDKARAELLAKLGIETIRDLITHLPMRYVDLRVKSNIRQSALGESAFVATVREIVVKKPRPRLSVTEITVADDSAALVLVWFNQPWISRSYSLGDKVLVAGQLELDYGMKKIVNPFIEKIDESSNLKAILPVYPSTEGLSQGWLRKIIAAALDDYVRVPDPLPYALLAKHKMPSLSWALQHIHYPGDFDEQRAARRRLAYEELFIFELALAKRKSDEVSNLKAYSHKRGGEHFASFKENLAFSLSEEQLQAIDEIAADMEADVPMRRILIGDVGTGKTLVALHAICISCDSGHQAALMAPTEVLAAQYAKKAIPQLKKVGISAALLTGSTKSAERKELLDALARGELQVLIGTHALIEPDVVFADLSLVVIDEQHRFGVRQRAALLEKSEAADQLAMTATPIPRSLAQTAFGDMEASYIRNRPVAGAGFKTKLLKFHQIFQAHKAVKAAVARGEQAYVVTALIDESDSLELSAALKVAEELAEHEYAGLSIGLLTGKMRSSEKMEVMAAFERGEIQVLVATTVIEVGVDVPNATVMLVLNAERFGLAQLHQIRGRVGRGNLPGQVFLISDSFGKEAKQRFEVLSETDDGFRLAEFDLAMRGAGEILGTRQSGLISFKIADIVEDSELISLSRSDAQSYVNKLDSESLGLALLQVEERIASFKRWAAS